MCVSCLRHACRSTAASGFTTSKAATSKAASLGLRDRRVAALLVGTLALS